MKLLLREIKKTHEICVTWNNTPYTAKETLQVRCIFLFHKHGKSIFIGLITGFANGLFGSGGGTIVVPCMQRLLKVETHKSHATAIAVILPLSILSLFIYIFKVEILWKTAIFVSIGGIAGGFVGAKLLNRLSGKWLHRIFGAFMVAAAVKMIL